MFNNIIDPSTNKPHNIHSLQGKKLLKQFIINLKQNGGIQGRKLRTEQKDNESIKKLETILDDYKVKQQNELDEEFANYASILQSEEDEIHTDFNEWFNNIFPNLSKDIRTKYEVNSNSLFVLKFNQDYKQNKTTPFTLKLQKEDKTFVSIGKISEMFNKNWMKPYLTYIAKTIKNNHESDKSEVYTKFNKDSKSKDHLAVLLIRYLKFHIPNFKLLKDIKVFNVIPFQLKRHVTRINEIHAKYKEIVAPILSRYDKIKARQLARTQMQLDFDSTP